MSTSDACDVALPPSGMKQLQSTIMGCVNEAMLAYGKTHGVQAGLRQDGSSCDCRTGVVKVWLANIGLCDDYASLLECLDESLPKDFSFSVGDGIYGTDATQTRFVAVRPKPCMLEALRAQFCKPAPSSTTAAAEGEEEEDGSDGPPPSRSCFALVMASAVLVGASAVLYIYAATQSVLTPGSG